MTSTGRAAGAIALAGVWVSVSEFLRNQFLLNSTWVNHFASLGRAFPASPVNGAVWGAWSFVFAGVIYALSRRFPLAQTTLIGWTAGFVMMWSAMWNLDVLPVSILVYAVPLSLLECLVAAWICRAVSPVRQPGERRSRRAE